MARSTNAESDTEFDAPGEVSGFNYEAALGHLLVVMPSKLEENVKTSYGDTSAVLADIHDITSKQSVEDALIFPKILVASLSKRIGGKVLAVLAQGVAKPGQSAPWILQDQSTNAKAANAANQYLATLKTKPKKPEPEAQAAAPEVQDWDADDAVPF